jgi:DNA-binding NarL/FixJ family response regulator
MKAARMLARSGRRARASNRGAELPAPRGLEASTFSIGDDDYVIFNFPLPDVQIPKGLTPAEEDVVRAVLDGHSNAHIARMRRTSSNTVANQLRSIYSKLRISGRLELIKRCIAGARKR